MNSPLSHEQQCMATSTTLCTVRFLGHTAAWIDYTPPLVQLLQQQLMPHLKRGLQHLWGHIGERQHLLGFLCVLQQLDNLLQNPALLNTCLSCWGCCWSCCRPWLCVHGCCGAVLRSPAATCRKIGGRQR